MSDRLADVRDAYMPDMLRAHDVRLVRVCSCCGHVGIGLLEHGPGVYGHAYCVAGGDGMPRLSALLALPTAELGKVRMADGIDLMGEVMAECDARRLTAEECMVLGRLDAVGSADVPGRHRGASTRTLTRLARRGLIDRHRGLRYSLTATGRRALEDASRGDRERTL